MKKRILLVDDERHVRTLLEATLDPFEEADVELVIASSGEQALELCRDDPPDLAFIDVAMPGIDGYATCDGLRAMGSTSHPHIVLMTEMGHDPDLARCEHAQIAEVVTKPFDPDHIRLLAGKLLHIDVEL